ncbi:MAG: Bor family protein [Cytophagales bacterium]|nr:Bor family protein [Cytophagales bacterium]
MNKKTILICLLSLFTLESCYHYRVIPKDTAVSTLPKPKVVYAFFWGAVEPKKELQPDDCNGNGLSKVYVTTNYGFALITVLTLGMVTPMTVQWECAKCSGAGDLGSPSN